MNKTRVRNVLMLGLVALLVVGVVTLAGCKAASTTGTTSASSGTTAASGGEATPTTAGETPSTAPTTGGTGSTETSGSAGGGEAMAPVSDNFKICTQCHGDFNQFLKDSKILTSNFSHAIHLSRGFKCEDCHVVPTHQPDKIVKPPMQNCFKCHGQEQSAKAPGACGACHPANFPLVPANHGGGGWLPAANPGLVKTVTARHSDMAKQDINYCKMCHAQKFCDSCHQVQMPHAADWQATHPKTVKASGDGSCGRCHPQQYICNDCHHKGYQPTDQPWRKQHPPIVKTNGAEPCFKCHNPLTCAHCHITGQFTDIAPKSQATTSTP